MLGGNAEAGILHVEAYRRALPSPAQRQGPPLGHRVPRVVHQIDQHPSEGIRVEGHHPELVEGVKVERDALRAQRRGHLLRPLCHEGPEVERFLLDGVDAHEGQVILDESVRRARLVFELREGLGNGRGAVRGRAAQFLLQQIDM